VDNSLTNFAALNLLKERENCENILKTFLCTQAKEARGHQVSIENVKLTWSHLPQGHSPLLRWMELALQRQNFVAKM
jgi:hypothetical protein